MKAFFEEYGLVLVVTVIVAGMLVVASEFQGILLTHVSNEWTNIIDYQAPGE